MDTWGHPFGEVIVNDLYRCPCSVRNNGSNSAQVSEIPSRKLCILMNRRASERLEAGFACAKTPRFMQLHFKTVPYEAVILHQYDHHQSFS